MRNLHIAFIGFPHPAHANATFSIVSALVRRGCRVTYTTDEQFGARIKHLGATALICTYLTQPVPNRGLTSAPHASLRVSDWGVICPMNARLLKELESTFSRDRPDVIIYDVVAFAGRILANQWQLPAIQVSPHCALDEGSILSQVRDTDLREHLLDRGMKAAMFFDRYGISGENWLYHREELNIHFIPRVFQPGGAALLDDRCLFSGRCVVERPVDPNWQKTHLDNRPIALVTGSMTYVRDLDYFKMCLDALTGLHWHVVLVIGDRNEPGSLRPLPAHTTIVRHASNTEILPHSSLLICQGGNMSTTEAAYHGVPVLAATFGFAELEWCAETSIVRLGLGKHLRDSIEKDTLRQAAIQIAEDAEVRLTLARVSELVQRDPDSEEVADRIEQHLASRS